MKNILKKDIRNFDKILEISLIVLTFISIIINLFSYPYIIYKEVYAFSDLYESLYSKAMIIMTIDNILIYLVSAFYIVDVIKEKKNILFKLSFCIFSILTTLLCSMTIINSITDIFKVILE